MAPARKPLSERFWQKVRKGEPDECWNWTGATTNGYGQIFIGPYDALRPSDTAHRVSWQMHHGAIGPNDCVLHRCDNPSCVNPKHLFIGSQMDNIADMHAKGRDKLPPVVHGTANVRAKLTPEIIARIRSRLAAGERPISLAPEFGISRRQIMRIRDGQTWKQAGVTAMIERPPPWRGTQQPSAKLTEDQVREIKARLVNAPRGTSSALAREFGVGSTTITDIRLGRRWTHIV